MKTEQITKAGRNKREKRVLLIMAYILVGISLFGQKVEILGDAYITGRVEVMDTILFADGTELASACLQVLSDGDNDTRIEVEKNEDEDIIRFTVNGVEIASFVNNRLEMADGGKSVFIGNKAGLNDDGSDNNNVFIGESSGETNTAGSTNTFIGSFSGFKNTDGTFNTYIGSGAGYSNVDGDRNTYLGVNAGFKNLSSNDNTSIGYYAGFNNNNAANTFIGSNAGLNNLGFANVFIGYEAGKDIAGSNKLVIDNSGTANPLIYGEFDNQKLEFDAWTRVLRRLDIDNNNLLFSNIQSGSAQGVQWSSTTTPKFEMFYSNQGIGNEKINMQFRQFATVRDLMTWDDSGNVGVGTQTPQRKLHVSTDTPTGHVMRIENTSSGAFASGLEIVINRSVTGPDNNYVTFKDANSTAGRIEGFRVGEGPNFTDFPEIDFNAYFDVDAMIDAVFTPGAFPTFNQGTWPTLNRGTLPSLSGGSFGSLNLNVDFDALADNLACQANPFCFTYDQWITGGLTGNSFPTLNRGSLPSLSGGTLPSLSGGSLPIFNLYGLINPEIRSTAYADIRTVAERAIINGVEAYNALDPFTNLLMQDPEYWNNIALSKNGGVTYGSKGADYAEWLEREDPSIDIKAGQIVGVRNGKISLNTNDADQIMAISVMPVVLGNMPDTTRQEDFEKVAFIGQTPVWVVGDVRSGDYIIASGQNDGYGLAVASSELKIGQIPMVVGRAWEDGDRMINLVNIAVGLKSNEMVSLLSNLTDEFSALNARVAKIEALISSSNLASK